MATRKQVDSAAAERFEMLPWRQLLESDLNPRKHFNQHKLDELAASIKERGIITPLIVRPKLDMRLSPDGADVFEVAAGHRRLRAAREVFKHTDARIPCRIVALDNEAFLEVLTIENLQREDIHPLEEADGFREMLRTGRYANSHKDGYDYKSLADRIGKTEAYVRGRLELCDLIPVVRQSFLDDNITIGHARLISRLPADKQEEALRDAFATEYDWRTRQDVTSLRSIASFRRRLQDHHGEDLSKAPFALDDATLKRDAGPCTTCPKCTGLQRSLIADDTGEQFCLDKACYSQKLNAHIMRKTGSGLVAISAKYSGEIPAAVAPAGEYVEAEPDLQRIQDLKESIAELESELLRELDPEDRQATEEDLAAVRQELAEVESDSGQCPHMERAIIVDAPSHSNHQLGIEKRICRNPQCPVHGEELQHQSNVNQFRETGSSAKGKTFAEIWRDKRKDLDDKIKIEARRELTRRVYESCPGKPDLVILNRVAERLAERIGHDVTAELISHVLKLEAPKHKYGSGLDTGAVMQKLLANSCMYPDKVWQLIVLMTVACTPQGYGGKDELNAIAEHLKIDAKAIAKEVGEPLIDKFNKQKAAALAKEKAAQEQKKPKKAKSGKMAAAGDDDEGGEE